MMGGSASGSAARRFVDSVAHEGEASLGKMRRVYSVDPTPALKERIGKAADSHESRIRKLKQAHERFERMMELSDDELRVANSNERIGPVFGDPVLVRRILARKMGEAEYDDLVNGPDVEKGRTAVVLKDDKK
jgi:hypothetical protein